MYKIIFVEDEAIVRKGVKNSIDWESTNFIFSGEASDGETALPLIREVKPDILITDIKMPFMNGLQLSRIVRTEMPWVKIIILSGYDEFDFAREALSIGVTEYLLKPFRSNELLGVLDRVSLDIENDRKKSSVNTMFPDIGELLKAFSPEVMKSSEKILFDYLKYGERSGVISFAESYIKCIGNVEIKNSLYYYYALLNLIVSTSKFVEEIGGKIENIIPGVNEIREISYKIDSIEELKKCFEGIIIPIIDYRDSKSRDKYSDIIIKVKEYIRMNYSNSDISLNSAAASVNISPNHLSAIFSRETGETFIEYLVRFRIRKAKELLKTTSMRSSEIAFTIGYTDPHYFSHTFKKIEKCTPNEYRNRG